MIPMLTNEELIAELTKEINALPWYAVTTRQLLSDERWRLIKNDFFNRTAQTIHAALDSNPPFRHSQEV